MPVGRTQVKYRQPSMPLTDRSGFAQGPSAGLHSVSPHTFILYASAPAPVLIGLASRHDAHKVPGEVDPGLRLGLPQLAELFCVA